ncbi:MAG TPA: RNA methyltransferase [Pontiella sp.]
MNKEITSAANPLVKHLKALVTSKKARQESGTFVLEGWRGIKTLLEHSSPHYRLEQIITSHEWLKDARLPESVDTFLLAEHLFEKISDVKNAQGILGVIRHTPCPIEFNPVSGNYLLLDRLRDPGNLGTLIRSSVGAGFDGLLLYGNCVEPFSPKVIRSSMGTFAFAHIWHVGEKEVSDLLQQDYTLYVTTGQGGKSLYNTRFGTKNVVVIGSEADGVSSDLKDRATQKITIPLENECESLNAAIAGSICMFEITRRTTKV